MRKIFVSLVLILLVSFPVFGENFLDNFNEKFQSFNDNFYSGELITGKQVAQVSQCGDGMVQQGEICDRSSCGAGTVCRKNSNGAACQQCVGNQKEWMLTRCIFHYEQSVWSCGGQGTTPQNQKECMVRSFQCISNANGDLNKIALCKTVSKNCLEEKTGGTNTCKDTYAKLIDDCIERELGSTSPPPVPPPPPQPPSVDLYQQCLTNCNINLPNLLVSCQQNSCPPTGIRIYATDLGISILSTISFGRTPPPGPSCRDNCQNIFGTNYCSNYCGSLYGSRPPGNICGNNRKEAPEDCDYYEGCPAGKTCANNRDKLGDQICEIGNKLIDPIRSCYTPDDCTRCVKDPTYVPPQPPPPPPPTQLKYKCSGASCISDPNGQFTTSNCNNQCQQTPTCEPDWECTYGECTPNNQQTATCIDKRGCGVNTNKPADTQPCTYVAPCEPDWECTYGECTPNNQQTATCTDSENCGVNTNKPANTQLCTYVAPPVQPSSCTANDWSCTSWSPDPCPSSGTQTRACNKKTDTNCFDPTGSTGKPSESQTCTPPVIPRGGDNLLLCVRNCWSKYESCVSSNSCDSKGNFDEEQQCKKDCDLPKDQCTRDCRNQFK